MIKKVIGFTTELASSCPYTGLVKKILFRSSPKEKNPQRKKTLPVEERIKIRKTNMRAGIFVMLIGVLCPVFWISLFSGASGEILLADFLHSSLFILGGFVFFLINKVKMNRILRDNSGGKRYMSESVECGGK
ncbi:MAG: hypothetical protein WCU00_11430 [Candidatus Latescibacterota bacterium]